MQKSKKGKKVALLCNDKSDGKEKNNAGPLFFMHISYIKFQDPYSNRS